jgi:hypothetical protein
MQLGAVVLGLFLSKGSFVEVVMPRIDPHHEVHHVSVVTPKAWHATPQITWLKYAPPVHASLGKIVRVKWTRPMKTRVSSPKAPRAPKQRVLLKKPSSITRS